ncbi:helix-turn-helix transcriptional regulator [Haloferacaceae archaeon DSL9]
MYHIENMPDPSSVMRVVIRRGSLLRAIDLDGVGKRDLVEQLSVSRSTVDRGIRELEQAGFVERTTGGYRRTLIGDLVLDEYETFESNVVGLLGGVEALEPLPAGTTFDASLLNGAEITIAERHAPHAPITALCSLIERAGWAQAVIPALFPQLIETSHRAVADADLRADFVLTEPVLEQLISTHPDVLATFLEKEAVTVSQIDRSLQYGLILVESDSEVTAGAVILDDGGARALVRNSRDEAVSWVRGQIDEHLRCASSLPSSPNNCDSL